MIINSIEELIGNTPILEIPSSITGLKYTRLYAKLEHLNPFGSIKDRIALSMLNGIRSEISKDKTVIESSSGNTAKALSLLCSSAGISFKAVTNRIKYDEVREILQAIGSQLEELPGYSDCADLFDPNDAIQYTKTLARTQPDKYKHTDQYFNQNNPTAHENTTAEEIIADLKHIEYLFGFLGTCGSTIGTGNGLRKYNPECKVLGVTSKPGHSIPGGRNMGELHEVGFFKKDFYNDFLPGTVEESIDGMLMLAKLTGILGGPTSGLIFLKACSYLKAQEALIEESENTVNLKTRNAVFFVCDRLEPYLGYLKKHRPSIFSVNKNGNLDKQITIGEFAEDASPTILANSEIILNQKLNTFIIDTRSSFAFSMGHIPGSINIQDSILEDMLRASSCFGKEHTVVVVCRLGDSSKRLAKILSTYGISAFSLEGGFQAYKKLGLAIDKTLNSQNYNSFESHQPISKELLSSQV